MKPLLILMFVSLFTISCTTTSVESDTGSLSLTVSTGKVGRYTGNRITMSKIVISIDAEGEDEIICESVLTSTSGTILLKEFNDLASGKEWVINIKTLDTNNVEIHSATDSFTLTADETLDLTINMNSKYSVLYATFSPIKDSVNKCEVKIDNAIVSDTSFVAQSNIGGLVNLSYDYLSASSAGVEHDVTLNVYGTMWGVNYLLYTGDTTIVVVSGEKVNCNLDLEWVGPEEKPVGDLGITVNIGIIDTVFINGKLIDDNVVIPDDGLVAYYPFNGNTLDESGVENHGIPVSAMLSEDRFGNPNSAYYFDGTLSLSNPTGHESYIYAPDNATLNFTDTKAFSFSVWVKGPAQQEGEGAGIITKGIGHHNEQYLLDVYHNQYRFLVNNPGGSTPMINTRISPSNSWEHLVGIFDASKGIMKLYLNSKLVGSATPVTSLNPTSEPLAIGSRIKYYGDGYNLNFNGSLDDVRLYNRAITSVEIQNLYSEGGYAGTM